MLLEAQVVGANDVCAVEYPPRRAEPGGKRPVGHGQVQASRGVRQQAVEHPDGVPVGDVFELVEGEHECPPARLDGADEEIGARRAGIRRRAVFGDCRAHIESGALEGEGEVGVERGGVVVGEGQPGHRRAGSQGGAAGRGEDGGLAEASWRREHGEGAAHGIAADSHRRTVAVVLGPVRDRCAVREQPRGVRYGAGQAAAGSPRRRRPAVCWRERFGRKAVISVMVEKSSPNECAALQAR